MQYVTDNSADLTLDLLKEIQIREILSTKLDAVSSARNLTVLALHSVRNKTNATNLDASKTLLFYWGREKTPGPKTHIAPN